MSSFQSSVLPPPPRSGHTAPSQSGANAPALVKIADGKKIYTVRNVSFEVDEHYDVIKAIGLGAYGLVCSAIDLRYVPDHPLYQKELLEDEAKGGMAIKGLDGKFGFYSPPIPNPAARGPHNVPTLRYHPFTRQRLSNGVISPYVAIKKIPKTFNDLIDGKRVLREARILQYLRGHENVVRVHDLLFPRPSQTKETFKDLYIVSELLDTDLHLVLKSRQPLEEDHLRYIMYQLLKCLAYTHSSGAIHRDLKPGNMLLTGSCELKVCDFGLARGGVPMRSVTSRPVDVPFDEDLSSTADAEVGGVMELTDYVITRYYRPPELLIMSNYNHAVDMWSAGCIFAEIMLYRPLFPGRDYLSQLTMIAQNTVLSGLPTRPEDLDTFFTGGTEGRTYLKDLMFRHQPPSGAEGDNPLENVRLVLFGRDVGRRLSTNALDIVHKLLCFDPNQRLTALEALRHPFFASLYSPVDELVRDPVNGIMPQTSPLPDNFSGNYESEEEPIADMWQFDQRELTEPDLRQLFWTEMDRFRRRKERFNNSLSSRTRIGSQVEPVPEAAPPSQK